MARIEVEERIAAPAGTVWRTVSDLDSEPKYWKGTKSVRNVSREGNDLVREVTIAFRDQKCMQKVTLEPESRITAEFTEGIIIGTKTVTLEPDGKSTILRTVWDVRMGGMMSVFSGIISRHIRGGTEQAMQAIKKEIESDV